MLELLKKINIKKYLNKFNKDNFKYFFKKHRNTLIIVGVILLVGLISVRLSFAFFTGTSASNIISGRLGDVTNPDVNFKFMIENLNADGSGTGSYSISYSAPKKGYTYNATKSNCTLGSYTKNEDGTFTINSTGKTKCEIYYDSDGTLNYSDDVELNIMKEVKSVLCTGTCGYKKVTDYNTTGLLNDGYAFDSTLSTCTNGATLSFDSLNNKLNVSSTSKTVCNAYFTVSKGPNLLELNTKQVAEGLQVTVASAPRGKVPVIYYYSTDNGNTYSTSTSNIYIINGLTVGTDYTFKVYAEDKDGNKSNIITKTVTKYSITNLVANGSFENGSTGWYLYSLSISSLKSKFGTYSVRNLNPSQWSAAHNYAETVTAAPSVTVGHNYYGSSWIITISRGNGYCYNDAGFYYDSTYHWMGMGGIQTSYNMWEKKSSIFLVPNVSNPFLNYGFAAYSGSDKIGECYADGAFLIDLTSTFGSGNEPSKEWLDNNIDYIDGTSSIYYMR